jgi:predicted GIY-YIG superfamily endonuclease
LRIATSGEGFGPWANACCWLAGEHNSAQGARWTAQRRPVKLLYAESHANKSTARKREVEIKGWRREKKANLYNSPSNIAFRRTGR